MGSEIGGGKAGKQGNAEAQRTQSEMGEWVGFEIVQCEICRVSEYRWKQGGGFESSLHEIDLRLFHYSDYFFRRAALAAWPGKPSSSARAMASSTSPCADSSESISSQVCLRRNVSTPSPEA